MLNENIRNLRKAKGLSQEALAIKLHVVRQTVSKWEKGLSVPDAGMIVSLAEELDTSASVLLGETVREECPDGESVKQVSEELEEIRFQRFRRSKVQIRVIRCLLITLCAMTVSVLVAFAMMNSVYLTWDFHDPELAVAGTLLHGFEFLFVRAAPFLLVGSAIGIALTCRKQSPEAIASGFQATRR